MENILKTCPFCGSEAEMVPGEQTACSEAFSVPFYTARCSSKSCIAHHITAGYNSMEAAAEAWNKTAEPRTASTPSEANRVVSGPQDCKDCLCFNCARSIQNTACGSQFRESVCYRCERCAVGLTKILSSPGDCHVSGFVDINKGSKPETVSSP